MPRTWFISDTHFCHTRIIELARRPFGDVREMDEAMIRAWNDVVAPDDTVRHVGDFAASKDYDRISAVFARLSGVKHLVVGNHDVENECTMTLDWVSITQTSTVEVDGTEFFLCHYPWKTWPGARDGAIHLFGHLHGRWAGTDKSIDVGVDAWGFRPISAAEILKRARTLKPDPDFAKGGKGALGPRM